MDLGTTLPYIGVQIFDLLISALALVVGFFLVKLVVYSFKKSLKKSKLPSLDLSKSYLKWRMGVK